MNKKAIIGKIEKMVAKASFSLRDDVVRLIKRAYAKETKTRAKKALKWILDNAQIAASQNLAICQDTGFPVVFIESSRKLNVSASLIDTIEKGIESGYRKNYLRPSVVDPIKRAGSSYKGMLYHLDFSPKVKNLKLTIFPKGFGSENKSMLKMFNPTVGLSNIEDFVVDCVRKAGPEACPPFVVGVGVGGTADYALLLAKKALLRKIDEPNSDKELKILEKNILKKINALGIGPMGFGGKATALAVKIKKSPTHIAGLPVGVNISCHALRSATIRIKG